MNQFIYEGIIGYYGEWNLKCYIESKKWQNYEPPHCHVYSMEEVGTVNLWPEVEIIERSTILDTIGYQFGWDKIILDFCKRNQTKLVNIYRQGEKWGNEKMVMWITLFNKYKYSQISIQAYLLLPNK